MAAGGGSYYFAKRSVNADKKARYEADMKRRRLMESLEFDSGAQSSPRNNHNTQDHAGSPSGEAGAASQDSAATHHPPANGRPKLKEKSKYEPSEPYRTKKGDRFS